MSADSIYVSGPCSKLYHTAIGKVVAIYPGVADTVCGHRSTVPAPATFLPVQTTLTQGEYLGTGGSDPVDKRNADVLGVDICDDSGAAAPVGTAGGIYGAPEHTYKVTWSVAITWDIRTCVSHLVSF
jgi:hypothetical protein